MRKGSLYLHCISVLVILAVSIAGSSILCLADDEIVISSCLMKGYGKPAANQRSDSPSTPLPDRCILRIPAEAGKLGEDDFASMRDQMSSLYQFFSVLPLTSAKMIWDGKRGNLNEAVMSGDMHLFPIQFYFHSLSGNSLSLRVEGLKFRFGEIRYLQEQERMMREINQGAFELFTETREIADPVGGEKWLDAELILPLGAPVILALPAMDHSYFLAIQANKKDTRQFTIGLVDKKLEFFNVSDADPVCGRLVGRGDGIEKGHQAEASLTYKGYTFLFCSQACLEKFQKDPEACLIKSGTKYYKKTTFTKDSSFIEVQKSSLGPEESIASRPSVLVCPVLPDDCRKKGVQGAVKTEVHVGESGNVRDVQVLEHLVPELDAAVVAVLRQWMFSPRSNAQEQKEAIYYVDVDFMLGQTQPVTESMAPAEGQPELKVILQGAAGYCRRLEDAALNYICWEKIKERVTADMFLEPIIIRRCAPSMRPEHGPDGMLQITQTEYGARDEYTYDYQLMHKEGRVVEQRILMKGNEGPKKGERSQQELRRIYFSKPIFAPIGLLDQDFQRLYDYSMLREEAVDGRAAWVLDIKPRKLIPGKPNYGKAWIDRQNGCVLKIEIDAESLEGYTRVQEDYVNRGIKPVFSIEILFGFEKKGLRYPSRMAIEEAYSAPKKGRTRVSQTTVDYNHYKFFTVETEDRIK